MSKIFSLDSSVIISIGVANILYGWLPWWTIVVALVLQVLLMAGSYMLLETRGWAYAKYLFATFTGNNKKECI